MAKKKSVPVLLSTRNEFSDKSVKSKVISKVRIEEGLEDNSQTKMLSDIYIEG